MVKESVAKKAPFFDAFYTSSFYKAMAITLISALAIELRLQIEDQNSKIHRLIKNTTKLEELKIHHKILFSILITFIASIIVLLSIFTFHYIMGKVIKLDHAYITPFY